MERKIPFSNGSEFQWWYEMWCEKCSRMRYDKDGMPTRNSCKYEKRIYEAMGNEERFPHEVIKDEIVGSLRKVSCTAYREEEPRKPRTIRIIKGQTFIDIREV